MTQFYAIKRKKQNFNSFFNAKKPSLFIFVQILHL